MKRINIFRIVSVFAIALVLFAACKDDDDTRLESQLATTQAINIKSDSATIIGLVIAGNDEFTEKGVCYGTSENPTIENSTELFVEDSASTSATFNVILKGLDYATSYYARAYAVSTSKTYYGEQVTFTTLPVVPTLSTDSTTSVTGSSATTGGKITVTGGAEIIDRGICYGTTQEPTIENDFVASESEENEFSIELTELEGNTTYYVRAYATNSAGTAYGDQTSFTTDIALPTVTTASVSTIDKTYAISGGEVTKDGGADVTARGLVYGLSSEPTLEDNMITSGTGTGTFVTTMQNLEEATTYYVRAYATNSAGTAYGDELSFSTLGNDLTWYVAGDFVASSYPSGYADWTPASSPYLKSSVSDPTNLQGYVYMANTSNNWKFATQADWDGTNYGAGSTDSTLDASGDNISLSAGYYRFDVNASNLVYYATATEWGIVGNATPSGWDASTALEYNIDSMVWRGVVHLTAGGNEFKFRANDAWDLNYGSTAGNDTLDEGGSNITVETEGDYLIELDLSTPLVYTYSANCWGVIGDATSGGWDSDIDMTWDETNKVFTVTMDLTANGSIKFRANNAWDDDYGDNSADGTLDAGGDNISISTSGNYTITLDIYNGTYSLTLN